MEKYYYSNIFLFFNSSTLEDLKKSKLIKFKSNRKKYTGLFMNLFIPNDEMVRQFQLLISDTVKKELDKFLDINENTNQFLNKKQTCEYLNISNNTLDNWIKQGLPCIKVGKTVRFSKTEINRWLQKQ